MPQISETVLAPELEGGQWIQHGPVVLKELRDEGAIRSMYGGVLILRPEALTRESSLEVA